MKNAADETDPGQLLNEWLGELDNLQKVRTEHSIVFFFSIRFSQCGHFFCKILLELLYAYDYDFAKLFPK